MKIFRDDQHAEAMAVICKRITFNAVYEITDVDTHENQKEQTYFFLEAFDDLQKYLAKEGFNPR